MKLLRYGSERFERAIDSGGIVGLLVTVGAVFLAVGACCVSVIAPASYFGDKYECGYAARNAGVETKFVKNHLFSWDCYVMVDGQWVPIDKWRGDADD